MSSPAQQPRPSADPRDTVITARHHYIALDSLRGIAALLVAAFHFPALGPLAESSFVRNAWLAVDFFFVLSGFVIAANYTGRLAEGFGIARFMALRLGRLYPLHLAMLLAYLATEFVLTIVGPSLLGAGGATFSGQTRPEALVTNLLLIQGLGVHDGLTWNGVAWSISTEVWMYILFAFLIACFGARRRAAFVAMAVVVVVALAVLSLAVFWPQTTQRFVDIARCAYGFALGAILQFALGARPAALASGMASGRARWRIHFTALELSAAAAMIALLVSVSSRTVHLYAPLVFAAAVAIFAFDAGWLSRILQARPFVFVGILSYSIYMVHLFLQARVLQPLALIAQKVSGITIFSAGSPDSLHGAARLWGTTPAAGTFWFVTMLTVLLTVSWLTYRLIEAPGRAWVRGSVGVGAWRDRHRRSTRPLG